MRRVWLLCTLADEKFSIFLGFRELLADSLTVFFLALDSLAEAIWRVESNLPLFGLVAKRNFNSLDYIFPAESL